MGLSKVVFEQVEEGSVVVLRDAFVAYEESTILDQCICGLGSQGHADGEVLSVVMRQMRGAIRDGGFPNVPWRVFVYYVAYLFTLLDDLFRIQGTR